MGDIPTIIPSSKPDSFWASKVNAGVKSNTAVSNPDVRTRKDSHGTTVSIKHKNKPTNEFLKWGGEFDATNAFDIDELIRVMPDTNYIDSAGSIAKADIGLWRCCYPVPPADYYKLLAKALPAIQLRYKRVDGVNYYPVWPEPANVAGPDNPNGRYWERCPPVPLCGE